MTVHAAPRSERSPDANGGPARVVLADDHEIVRVAVRHLLETHGIEVVGEAEAGSEAIELITMLHPDLALIDVTMPHGSGLEVVEQALAASPATRMVLLTMHDEEEYVVAALHSGVRGYVLKSDPMEDVLRAVREVSEGRVFLSPNVSQIVLHAWMHDEDEGDDPLTDRERQVLTLVAEGLTSREAAERLGISDKTVDAHRSRIKAKLGAETTADLVRYAISKGLVEI